MKDATCKQRAEAPCLCRRYAFLVAAAVVVIVVVIFGTTLLFCLGEDLVLDAVKGSAQAGSMISGLTVSTAMDGKR